MSSIDVNQARLYIELLRGNGDTVVCWQLFDDSGLDTSFPVNFHGSLSQVLPELLSYQSKGYGAYITINPTDGNGRMIDNIVSYDWAFADIDGNVIPSEYPLLPAFISSRDDTHGHIYWPVEGCLTSSQYSAMQMRIALYLDSDRQVTDVARVARVPGLLHLKNRANPVTYKITTNNNLDFNYTMDEIESAFKLSPEKELELSRWVDTRTKLDSGTGFNDNPLYRKQFIDFLREKAPVAVEGSGSFTVYKVAGFGYDRGLGYTEAQELMWEHYNPRCQPTWDDTTHAKRQFYTYIKNAWTHAKNAIGCKTVTAQFAALPTPEPTGGWDNNAKLKKDVKVEPVYGHIEVTGDIAYITPTEAAANRVEITSKSSVVDHAIKFIGDFYPLKTLVRCEKMFYEYNGIHWEEVSDEEIKAKVNKCFTPWKFAPSKINNIYTMVEMLCFERGLQKGLYMSDRSKSGDNCIIMRNGILEITGGKVDLKPHTRDLFDLNALDYDYDPNARCDEFLKFISAQWPGDIEMHNQIQELYGLSLINDNRYHLLPIMVGKSRSGKGVHARIMTTMVGKHNVCNPHLESLLVDSILNTMSTKRLAIVPEANALHPSIKDRVLNRLKSLSANDGVEFDRKYKGSITCSKWPMLLIQSNELPDFADGSGAYGNRVWPFHFTRSFAGVEDRYLGDRLCEPSSIAGVFTWALKGLMRVLEKGEVTIAASSKEMIEEIKYDTFILSSFVDDFCNIDVDGFCYVDDMYDFYLVHCKIHSQKMPLSPRKFAKILTSCHHPINKRRETIVKEGEKRRYIFTGISINRSMYDKHMPQRQFSNVVNIK